jgi:hypothetical protein
MSKFFLTCVLSSLPIIAFQQIEALSHATKVINHKAHNAELCREELRAVSVEDIEIAERILLEGNDYRLRCHHPYGAIKVLSSDIRFFFRRQAQMNAEFYGYRHGYNPGYPDELLDTLFDRALAVAQSALVYSDVNFLFQPGKVAFAAIAIALEGRCFGGRLGSSMRNYLRVRFPQKTVEELYEFESEVSRIISSIESCPAIDLNTFSAFPQRCRSSAIQIQAAEVRRVFSLAARLRGLRKTKENVQTRVQNSRKRIRVEQNHFTEPQNKYFKAARVTPIQY